MLFRKQSKEYLETRWCLGTTIVNNQFKIYPVYKNSVFQHDDSLFLCQASSEFQGVLAVSQSRSFWFSVTNEPIENVLKHLPELEMHMIKEERL